MSLMLLLALGLSAGILSGLFGIGGGVVIVAALVLIGRMPIMMATGTSLGALLLPVGLLGAMEYHRRGLLDVKASALIALGLFLGAWFGAKIALGTPPATLQRLFAVFLIILAVRMWIGAGR
ncbi:MAG TPA: sulfite exporter TauE/SafE family protein [Gemmatimonadales bacterium]|nr:sulfite exporter TauE/SafE family protein [Gemmatimonadales bacterium]